MVKDRCRPWILVLGQACVRCARRWTGPAWGQRVEGAPGGKAILLLLGLAGRLPGGAGPTRDSCLECGKHVTASPKAAL